MATQVGICNAAIIPLGGQPIIALTDLTKEARACNELWDFAFQEVLGACNWNFAKKWVALTEYEAYTFVDGEYAYAYTLPTDFVRLVRTEYSEEKHDIRGGYILCNSDNLSIEYVWLVTDYTSLPYYFVTALVERIKADLAIPLARKETKQVDYLTRYLTVYLPKAMKIDGQHRSNPQQTSPMVHTESNDTWLQSRTG
jgi:hypothetical protein